MEEFVHIYFLFKIKYSMLIQHVQYHTAHMRLEALSPSLLKSTGLVVVRAGLLSCFAPFLGRA